MVHLAFERLSSEVTPYTLNLKSWRLMRVIRSSPRKISACLKLLRGISKVPAPPAILSLSLLSKGILFNKIPSKWCT